MMKMFTTDPQHSLREVEDAVPCPERINGLPLIQVDPARQHQEILGFGVALTDSACYLVSQMADEDRQKFLADIFSPAGLGLSVTRVCVGASDYAREPYNYAKQADDFELRSFSIEHDRQYVIPTIQAVRAINPEMFLFSSTWSPPGWMKTGGSMFGGWLRQPYLETYARYYVKFLEAYAQAGIPIQALTPQNEVETDQAGKMPATLLHPDLEASFVRDYLKPLLDERGLTPQIWILDHNFSLWYRAKWMLDDPALKKAVSGVAFHYYDGTPDMLSLLHEAHPEIDLHWTEGGPDLGPSYASDWCRWSQVFSEALRHGCRSITGWNLLLDENGRPNIGPFRCAGLVTRHSQTGELSYSGQYRAFAHYSQFIQRGARRVSAAATPNGLYQHATGEPTRLYCTAFQNPGGAVIIILTNPGEKKEVQLALCGAYFRVALPANAVSTLVFTA